MRPSVILGYVLVLATSQLLGQATQKPPVHPAPQDAAHAQTADKSQNGGEDGQRVFQQNCARCHNAPSGFPPSISGTVAHHMRVRANLSEKEYKALLSFFNP